jgi:hypothetical protein
MAWHNFTLYIWYIRRYYIRYIRNQIFNIASFQVVPLTSHLGIIQWVDGTEDLKGLMLGVLDKNEKES